MDELFPRIVKVYEEKGLVKRPSKLSEEEKERILQKLFAKDPTLFSLSPEVVEKVKNRLGWVDGYRYIETKVPELKSFAEAVRAKFKQVVWCGMGGSALFPYVLSQMFAPKEGFPNLIVLDTNAPENIEEVEKLNIEDSLFVIASKSGTTIETLAHFKYFWKRAEEALSNPGEHFVALTDPGSPLEALAKELSFLRVFHHPSDIGGRYAALTEVGFLPAALLGLDLDKALHYAKEMYSACESGIPWGYNLASTLAEYLVEHYIRGEDKLTFIVDPILKPFVLWIEQLIAESLGKDGTGIVPVVGESPGSPTVYATDRAFIYLTLRGREGIYQRLIQDLKEEGFPIKTFILDDRYEVFGEAYRWMLATAISGYLLTVNPFDEPDVVLTKQKTKEFLKTFKTTGDFGIEFYLDEATGLGFYYDKTVSIDYPRITALLKKLFSDFAPWIFIGILAYLPVDDEVEDLVRDIRTLIREKKNCATVFGFGPRYLHSTGQLFKGGPPLSRFIILTYRGRRAEQVIPGEGYTFWDQMFAQACGDFRALEERKKPVIMVHLTQNYKEDLKTLYELIKKALSA
jgi:glucose-6-phosphate isomerase